ncbi:PAS domain S-box protein, partial [Noviherbaspirillum denitrificans]|uniref:PAS domain S-box protein n=1 Tax=Noviherbaspirillum denitrificans TaxID=1968433 RepID=UPI00197F9AE2
MENEVEAIAAASSLSGNAWLGGEERYRGILETIEDAYYEVDLQGNLVLFNSALCRLLGYDAGELFGCSHRRLQPAGEA